MNAAISAERLAQEFEALVAISSRLGSICRQMAAAADDFHVLGERLDHHAGIIFHLLDRLAMLSQQM